MREINLRNLFPEYKLDCFVEVPDEDVDAFITFITKEAATVYFEAERRESAFRRRKYRNKAHYSLDAGDGIEHDALHKPLQPHEIVERKELLEALSNLPEKQRNRIYKHYFLGNSKAAIARSESLSENAVKDTIYRALKNLEQKL